MKKKVYLVVGVICFFLLFAVPTTCFAVAGGHGGGSFSHSGGGGSSIEHGTTSYGYRNTGGGYYGGYGGYGSRNDYTSRAEWLAPFVLMGGFYGFRRYKRTKGVRARKAMLLATMPGSEKQKRALCSEIETIFLSIQQAWDQEAIETVSHCYTKRLFDEHQRVLHDNAAEGIRNHTKKVSINYLDNYRKIHEESFSIRIDFSCFDYTVDRQDGRILSGDRKRQQQFSQLWYFDYDQEGKHWRADFIQPIYT